MAVPTFGGSTSSTSNASTYNFSVDIGPAVDKLVIVAAHSGTLASGSIAGTAATVHITSANPNPGAALMSARTSLGSTQTVSITLGSTGRSGIGWWYETADLVSDTPYHTATGTTTCNINTPAKGFAISCGSVNAVTTFTPSNTTERYDIQVESNHTYTGGDTSPGEATTNVASSAGSGTPNSSAASWQYAVSDSPFIESSKWRTYQPLVVR